MVEYGLTVGEFQKRRRNLVQKLLKHSEDFRLRLKRSVHDKDGNNIADGQDKVPKKHLVVMTASQKKFMVDKIPYFYRPSTDLRYLTGHTEPNSALVLEIETESGGLVHDFRSIMFVQDANPKEEKWEGPRVKPDEAVEKYGVDSAHYIGNLGHYLKKHSNKECVTWYDYLNPSHDEIHRMMTETMFGKRDLSGFQSPRQAVHETRVVKSPAEIQLMRKTCQIAAESIKSTISQTLDWTSESQAFATVDYHCRVKGASYLAYPPVVASGDHATIIHYTANINEPLDRSELMLMDAGCEYGGYTSDITRTWPLSGKIDSTAKRLVYEAVYDVQNTLIRVLKAGNLDGRPITIDSLYHEAQRLFKPHLVNLGLIPEDCDSSQANV